MLDNKSFLIGNDLSAVDTGTTIVIMRVFRRRPVVIILKTHTTVTYDDGGVKRHRADDNENSSLRRHRVGGDGRIIGEGEKTIRLVYTN